MPFRSFDLDAPHGVIVARLSAFSGESTDVGFTCSISPAQSFTNSRTSGGHIISGDSPSFHIGAVGERSPSAPRPFFSGRSPGPSHRDTEPSSVPTLF